MKWLVMGACLWAGQTLAGWQFAPPVDVLEAKAGIFPHLDAANRQGLGLVRRLGRSRLGG